MQNSMVIFVFSVSNWKYPIWENLVQISLFFVFEYEEFDDDVQFSLFWARIPFLQ